MALPFRQKAMVKINTTREFEQYAKAEELNIKGLTGEPGVKTEPEMINPIEKVEQFEDQKQKMDQIHKSTVMTTSNYSAHGGDSAEDAYNCPRCDKTFRSRNTLNKHTYRTHKSSVMATRNSSPVVFFSGSSAEEKKATLLSMISWNGTVLSCTICGKTKDKIKEKNAKTKIEQHIESLHTEGG